jgi:tripartite-type tricarboxylate transporter receptor subunit TctC
MLALLLAEKADIKLKFVPYRGSPQIATDMLSGSLDMSSDYLGNSYMQHIKSGALKPIAIPSQARTPVIPDTQTFREAGFDIVVMPWQGIMAPKGTPRPIIDKISAALADYVATDEFKEKLAAVGQQPAFTTPDGFRDIVVREEAMWRDIIKKHNIRNE